MKAASASSHATLQTLTKKQLINRANNLQRDLLNVKKQQKRVQERIERMFKDECITLDEKSGKDCYVQKPGIGTIFLTCVTIEIKTYVQVNGKSVLHEEKTSHFRPTISSHEGNK